jgi:hypothetical protein
MTGGCEYLNITVNKQQKVDFSCQVLSLFKFKHVYFTDEEIHLF